VTTRFVRAHLAVTLAVTLTTAWFSYAYFHIDEFFQVIEFARYKLGLVDPWALPWEYKQQMRPWLQPFVYWLVGKAFGVQQLFTLAFVARLVTGLANVGALALFLRTTLPWFASDEEKKLHVRVATLLGFLPYLYVRTSSESGSMAALTAAFAVVLEGSSPNGRRWTVPVSVPRLLLGGFLFGLAFEMRFQTALVTLGVALWLAVMKARRLVLLAAGFALAVALGALVDRWGYGTWTFPAWTYLQANVFEGAAGLFGTDPPFAYLWMLPANIFFPVVIALLVVAVLAWWRSPWHPVTWATLPFFLVHNVLSHKEERFLFPIAILATTFVTMAGRKLPKLLAVPNFAGMLLLMFYPLGWHHNVRLQHHLAERFGDEVHATVTPEIDLSLPAFHARIYDVEKADPEEIARRIQAGTARPWIITERRTLDLPATLVYSELDPRLEPIVDTYNAFAFGPLRKLRYRSLYRVR
jgi:phosphatidylinositol glycan class B